MARRYVIVSLLTLTAAGWLAAGQRAVVESILVRVNDRIVTTNNFQRRLEVEIAQTSPVPIGDDLKDFAREIFDSVVNETILLERAQEKGLIIDDEMVDRQIEGLREENNLQSDENWEHALQGAGLTVEQLRELYRRSMLISDALRPVQPTEITEQEIRDRYQRDKEQFRVPARVELQQLLFTAAADGSDGAAVMRRARGLVERVRAGSDLEAEAALAGIDVQDLGGIPLDDLRADLRWVLERLDEGSLTDPLDTAGGVQVIRLARRIPEGYQPFDDVEEVLRRQLSNEAYQGQTKGIVDSLKKEYLVEVHEDRLELLLETII